MTHTTRCYWAAAVFCLSLPCFAQLDRGTITEALTDSSGAAIPGERISIRNLGTNATYQSATTGTGEFEAIGLKTLVRANILVAVSETVRVDAALQLGESKECITVSAEATALQTDSPVVGVVLQNRVVNELLLNFGQGRS